MTDKITNGDNVQLKDGVGTIIAISLTRPRSTRLRKKTGRQRCLVMMRESGKKVEVTVHPRQVI